jgi:TetR/AcrR family transcriptional repressor of mexJK operon
MKTLRTGETPKRAAILAAARDLFLTDGYDRTSVDAVAARASVSKRTVYDYFGDKQALLHAVLEAAGAALLAAMQSALDSTIPADVAPDRLEEALIAFVMALSTDMLATPEYTALWRFVENEPGRLTHVERFAVDNEPEEALARRLGELADRGLIETDDPRLAADQFVGLTFAVAMNRVRSYNAKQEPRVGPLLAAGARTFVRAYRKRG